jgi:uncharacterized protein YprB with RNaseH-like and TPR domain
MSTRQLFSESKGAAVLAQIPLFEAALAARSADFFISRLPCGHKLRVLPEFQSNLAFLDIETTGLTRTSVITVMGVHINGSQKTFIRGENFSEFIDAWQHVEILVTFNGTQFDIPFLMREFGLSVHPPHIDLMHEAKHWGFWGGLKTIEGKLGTIRTADEQGTGSEAIKLWHAFDTTGHRQSLEKLVAYNTGDVRSLLLLSRHLWRLSCQNYNAPHPLFHPNFGL